MCWASPMPSLRRAFGMKAVAGAGRAPERWWCTCLCDVLGRTVLVCGPRPEGGKGGGKCARGGGDGVAAAAETAAVVAP